MMHATMDAPETPHKLLRNLAAAFARCDRLFVHSPGDLNRLKAIGLVEDAALFAHGVIDLPIREVARRDGPFVISSYGFASAQRLLQLLEATSHLVPGRECGGWSCRVPAPHQGRARGSACLIVRWPGVQGPLDDFCRSRSLPC